MTAALAIKLALGVVGLGSAVFAFWKGRQGRKAGRDEAENNALKEQAQRIAAANAARAESDRKSASDGLRDDDGYRRD